MILNDRQILELAESKEIIVPFHDCQIRSVNGLPAISFGLSSFGYDLRAGMEWKIFNNVHAGTIIDPKNFSPNSFFTIFDETCVIPPNSFALTHSVERLKMPQNVTGICIGKSTYARCFAGDTKVALVDNTSPTFLELVKRYEEGEQYFYGYGVKNSQYVAQRLTAPRLVEYADTIYITLDNGEVLEVTEDHLFMLRDGTMERADNLYPGSSLMPLYRTVTGGYERIWNPMTRTYTSTANAVKESLLRANLIDLEHLYNHCHHIDENTRNNLPNNLQFLSASAHAKLHNAEKDLSAQSKLYWDDKINKERHLVLLHSETARQKAIKSRKDYYATEEGKKALAIRQVTTWKTAPKERRDAQAEHARQLRLRSDITEERVREALYKEKTIRGAANYLKVDRSAFKRFPEIIKEFKNSPHYYNHKVSSICPGRKHIPVYCLTAEVGNFALEAGIIVSNCGIIVNVTPIEAGWEGYVTIEVSNTTPLPVKVYSNEGIAQLIFLQGDLPETTYADRSGKYMNQPRAVVLPKL